MCLPKKKTHDPNTAKQTDFKKQKKKIVHVMKIKMKHSVQRQPTKKETTVQFSTDMSTMYLCVS